MILKLGRFLTDEAAERVRTGTTIRDFVEGFGAAVTVVWPPAGRFRRTYAGRGVGGDWAAVGDDIRRAAQTLDRTTPDGAAAVHRTDPPQAPGKEGLRQVERAPRQRA